MLKISVTHTNQWSESAKNGSNFAQISNFIKKFIFFYNIELQALDTQLPVK
jgi:hypothetical protein